MASLVGAMKPVLAGTAMFSPLNAMAETSIMCVLLNLARPELSGAVSQVVNICANNCRGDGYKWQLEHEAEHVSMVHVMLCNDGRDAVITWSDKWEETLTLQSAAHGELEFHLPPEL